MQQKQKERRIVTWTPQEDDILREQIGINGTDNWTIIASNFKDKTTRQCRRRWYTYLNTDFKKGGWSPEEDMLLCEAQKIYGNRWTEIAKVVSGRTDNAVKNRFTTLCKKRARIEAIPKENNTSTYINANSKRVFSNNNAFQFEHSPKKPRSDHINVEDVLDKVCETEKLQRLPLAVLSHQSNVKIEGTFLKKDDPKILALYQQAELLSSLAMKVNTENMQQENASEGNDMTELSDLLEDLRSSNTDIESSQRQYDMYDSPSGSEYSNGSSFLSTSSSEQITSQEEIFSEESISALSMADFSSPVQINPFFTSFAATVPSPQFSESERHYLMKTLGIESPSITKNTNLAQPPPCRRALVHSL